MINSTDAYKAYIEQCLEKYPDIDDAMRFAASSDGRSIKERGEEELSFLIREGLKEHDYVIDVGCGAGALLQAGIENRCGPYLGFDVSKKLVRYAEAQMLPGKGNTCATWSISEACGDADWVVFFSVFSHMLDHEIYRMLEDAFRVLGPGGRVVFTYRDWSDEGQWPVFMNIVKADDAPGKIPIYDNLIAALAVRMWLRVIGFDDLCFYHPHLDDTRGVLGQSTVIARKP